MNPALTVYDNLCILRSTILVKVAEAMCYPNRGGKVDIEFLHNKAISAEIRTADLEILTDEQLRSLGFNIWSNDNPDFYLLPLWLVPFLNQDDEVVSINGGKKQLKHVDLDHRAGFIFYGIVRRDQ